MDRDRYKYVDNSKLESEGWEQDQHYTLLVFCFGANQLCTPSPDFSF